MTSRQLIYDHLQLGFEHLIDDLIAVVDFDLVLVEVYAVLNCFTQDFETDSNVA